MLAMNIPLPSKQKPKKPKPKKPKPLVLALTQEAESGLVYTASSRAARAPWRDPISKGKRQRDRKTFYWPGRLAHGLHPSFCHF